MWVRVAEEMTWACRTAAARSAVASAATPSARSSAATVSARAAVRFHTRIRRSDGRTLRCARTSHGAIAPAPSMTMVCGSAGASKVAPRAESAAVFQHVISVPSSTARGRPVTPSNST